MQVYDPSQEADRLMREHLRYVQLSNAMNGLQALFGGGGADLNPFQQAMASARTIYAPGMSPGWVKRNQQWAANQEGTPQYNARMNDAGMQLFNPSGYAQQKTNDMNRAYAQNDIDIGRILGNAQMNTVNAEAQAARDTEAGYGELRRMLAAQPNQGRPQGPDAQGNQYHFDQYGRGRGSVQPNNFTAAQLATPNYGPPQTAAAPQLGRAPTQGQQATMSNAQAQSYDPTSQQSPMGRMMGGYQGSSPDMQYDPRGGDSNQLSWWDMLMGNGDY